MGRIELLIYLLYNIYIIYNILYFIYYILYIIYPPAPLGPPGCEAELEDQRVKGASKLYLRIRGVFKELRGFRILGSSNVRILVVAICGL